MLCGVDARFPPMGWLVLITSLGFAVVQLDVTIVNVALPRIGAELNTGITGLQWIVDTYTLVYATFLLTSGFLGDRFGARRVYMTGLLLFAIASLSCGLAYSESALIVGRAAQGIGAAVMLPSSLALLNHASNHDTKLRAWAVGWWTAAGSIAISSGPVLGGLLMAITSWRAIFFINLPLCLLGALAVRRLPEINTHKEGHFDPLGQILSIAALGCIIGAVIEMNRLGLSHPRVLSLLMIGFGAAVAFIFVESRVSSPMLPLNLFRMPAFSACILYGIAMNLTYYGMIFILSLYLQRALGYDAVQAGFAYLPLTASFIVGNLLSGRVVGRFGSRWPMIWGALIDAAGFALLLPLGLNSSYWAMLIPFALMPGGMGTGIPAGTTAVLGCVPRRSAGTGVAVLNAARQAAGAIGVAIFGAFAGEDPSQIIAGLHLSAATAIAILCVAAAMSFAMMPRQRESDQLSKDIPAAWEDGCDRPSADTRYSEISAP